MNNKVKIVYTGIRESFEGHQVWFKIDNQSFNLDESIGDTESESYDHAVFKEKNLWTAFKKLGFDCVKKDSPYFKSENQKEIMNTEDKKNELDKFYSLPKKDLATAYHILFGKDWNERANNESKAEEMKSIFSGGNKPCISFSKWIEYIDFLRGVSIKKESK